MARLISEAIRPLAGGFDPAAMAQGEPGLPAGFRWRERTFAVAACERRWKKLGPESKGGELYLRRHYFALRMEDGSLWTVYCLRQPSSAGSGRQRWYLYSID